MGTDELHTLTANLRQTTAVLYSGSDFAIWDVRCCGHDTPARTEEVSASLSIILPRHGVYVWKMGRQELTSTVNHITLLHYGQAYRVAHPAGGDDRSTAIAIRPSTLRSLLADVDPPAEDLSTNQLRFPLPQVLADPRTTFMHWNVISLTRHCPANTVAIEEATTELCHGIVREAHIASGRKMEGKRKGSISFYRERVDMVKTYLASHYTGAVHLHELARLVAVSPYHLSRIFTQVVGMPVHKYLTRLRLNAAFTYLSDGATNLTQVALDSGFSSHSHFSASFRSEFGVPPSHVRHALARRGFRKDRRI